MFKKTLQNIKYQISNLTRNMFVDINIIKVKFIIIYIYKFREFI